MRLLGGRSGPPTSRSRSSGDTYCVPEIHCTLEMVGRGGHSSLGLTMVSGDCCHGLPVPQTWITASSLGPDHAKMSPVCVTTADVLRVASTMGSSARPRSLSPGIENARAVRSPNSPTMAQPCSSSSATVAASQSTSSNSRDAPLAWAGRNTRISFCVTVPC